MITFAPLLALALVQPMPPRQPGPPVGSLAPLVQLLPLEGTTKFNLRSNFGKRNTVLIFGSCT